MSGGGCLAVGGGCTIPYTQIAVDTWRPRQATRARVFFVSHVDEDLLSGLTTGWSHPIYCSPITRHLLLQRVLIEPSLVHALELNQPHTIPLTDVGSSEAAGADQPVTMTVTLIKSDHCPGSVMFLFEGYFGRVIYTGNFRFTPVILESPVFREFISKPVDSLYLDNTYCSPKCCFPTKMDASQEIIDIINRHPHDKVVLGFRDLGNNDFLIRLAQHFSTCIGVTEERYKALELLLEPQRVLMNQEQGDSESTRIIKQESRCGSADSQSYDNSLLMSQSLGGLSAVTPGSLRAADLFRIIPTGQDLSYSCRIDAIPLVSITRPNLDAWNRGRTTVVILATAVFSALGFQPFQKEAQIVELSSHSSYPELLHFVETVRPKSVVPLARGAGAASGTVPGPSGVDSDPLATALPDRASVECFQDLLDRTPMLNFHIPSAVLELMNQTDIPGSGPLVSGIRRRFRRRKVVTRNKNRRSTRTRKQSESETSEVSTSDIVRSCSSSCEGISLPSSVPALLTGQREGIAATSVEQSLLHNSAFSGRSQLRGEAAMMQRISLRTAALAARQAALIQHQRQQMLAQSKQFGFLGSSYQRNMSNRDRVAAAAALASISMSKPHPIGRKLGLVVTNKLPKTVVSTREISKPRGGGVQKFITVAKREALLRNANAKQAANILQTINESLKVECMSDTSLGLATGGVISADVDTKQELPGSSLFSSAVPHHWMGEVKQEQHEALDLSTTSGSSSTSQGKDDLKVDADVVSKVVHEINTPASLAFVTQLISENRGVLVVSDAQGPSVLIDSTMLGGVVSPARTSPAACRSVTRDEVPNQPSLAAFDACGRVLVINSNQTNQDVCESVRSAENVIVNPNEAIQFVKSHEKGLLTVVPVDKANLLLTSDNLQPFVLQDSPYLNGVTQQSYESTISSCDPLEIPAKCTKRHERLNNEVNERADKCSENITQINTEFRNPLTGRRSSFSECLNLSSFHVSPGQLSGVTTALEETACDGNSNEDQPDLVQCIAEKKRTMCFNAEYQQEYEEARRWASKRLSESTTGEIEEVNLSSQMYADVVKRENLLRHSAVRHLMARKASSEGFIPGITELRESEGIDSGIQMSACMEAHWRRRSSVGTVPGRMEILRSLGRVDSGRFTYNSEGSYYDSSSTTSRVSLDQESESGFSSEVLGRSVPESMTIGDDEGIQHELRHSDVRTYVPYDMASYAVRPGRVFSTENWIKKRMREESLNAEADYICSTHENIQNCLMLDCVCTHLSTALTSTLQNSGVDSVQTITSDSSVVSSGSMFVVPAVPDALSSCGGASGVLPTLSEEVLAAPGGDGAISGKTGTNSDGFTKSSPEQKMTSLMTHTDMIQSRAVGGRAGKPPRGALWLRGSGSDVENNSARVRLASGGSLPSRGSSSNLSDRSSPGLNTSDIRLPPKKKWRKRYRTSTHQENKLVVTGSAGIVNTVQICHNPCDAGSSLHVGVYRRDCQSTDSCVPLSPTLPDLVAPQAARPAPLAQNIRHRVAPPQALVSRPVFNSNLGSTGYMTRSRVMGISPSRSSKPGSDDVKTSNKKSASLASQFGGPALGRVQPQRACAGRSADAKTELSAVGGQSMGVGAYTPRATHPSISRLRRLDMGSASSRRRNPSGSGPMDKVSKPTPITSNKVKSQINESDICKTAPAEKTVTCEAVELFNVSVNSATKSFESTLCNKNIDVEESGKNIDSGSLIQSSSSCRRVTESSTDSTNDIFTDTNDTICKYDSCYSRSESEADESADQSENDETNDDDDDVLSRNATMHCLSNVVSTLECTVTGSISYSR